MTPLELANAIKLATPGTTINVPAGSYGSVTVNKPGLTIVADPNAIFDKITVTGTTDAAWTGGHVEIPSVPATVSSTAGVRVVSSQRVKISGLTIRGATAVSGALETASTTDPRPGDNIIGRPTGRGVSVEFSDTVEVLNCDISHCHKGINLSRSPNCHLVGNHIWDLRTSSIVGDAPDGTRIDNNHLHDNNPWQYGGTGDHGDFIHLWTPAGMGYTQPTRNVSISNNFIEQGAGTALLAIFLEDNSSFGFEGVAISNNIVLNGNAQGIALSHVKGNVNNNLLLQTSGTVKNAPSLLLRPGCEITFAGNRLADTYGTGVKLWPLNDWLVPGVQSTDTLTLARWMAARR